VQVAQKGPSLLGFSRVMGDIAHEPIAICLGPGHRNAVLVGRAPQDSGFPNEINGRLSSCSAPHMSIRDVAELSGTVGSHLD
jgi:hypothetical protein